MLADRAAARRELARIVDSLTIPSAGTTPDPVPSAPVPSAPPPTATTTADDTMLAVARSERVVPFLARALTNGLVTADDDTAAAIDEAWNLSMRRCLVMEERIVWLHGELTARGVEMRVLKGSASAHLDHRGPEWREFGDIDILVHGSDMPAVYQLFDQEGFERSHQTPSPAYDQRFIKSAMFRRDVEFDVHRTLTDNPLGHRIDVRDLWAEHASFTLGTTTVSALSDELRFIHACLHGYLSRPPMRLSTLSDLLALVRRTDLDHDRVLDIAGRWGLREVVTAAVADAIAQATWPGDIDLRYAEPDTSSIGGAALIAAHRSPLTSSTAQTLLSLATLPDTRTRIEFVRSLVMASPQYRSEHRRPVRTAATRLARALGAGRGAR